MGGTWTYHIIVLLLLLYIPCSRLFPQERVRDGHHGALNRQPIRLAHPVLRGVPAVAAARRVRAPWAVDVPVPQRRQWRGDGDGVAADDGEREPFLRGELCMSHWQGRASEWETRTEGRSNGLSSGAGDLARLEE